MSVLRSMDSRAAELVEAMDDPACDPVLLANTYRHFRAVNAVVSGWRGTYQRVLRPVLREIQRAGRDGNARPSHDQGPRAERDRGAERDRAGDGDRPVTLLDVGSGGGDLAIALAGWARRDGIRIEVTGADPDERAYRAATARLGQAAAPDGEAGSAGSARPAGSGRPAGSACPAGSAQEAARIAGHGGLRGTGNVGKGAHDVRFVPASTTDLLAAGERFDIVVSNHVLHHLRRDDDLLALLDDSARLARRLVVHADITRNRLGYVAFSIGMAPFFRDSFIRADGLVSIRRSYRPDELRALLPPEWRVVEPSPFRYLVVRDQRGNGVGHA